MSVEGIHHHTDPRTGAVDRIPAAYWSDRLHVLTNPLAPDMPRDRLFWIVTDEGEAQEVSYCYDAHFWTGDESYLRQDGEAGCWTPDEIMGWTTDAEDAEEAAALFLGGDA